MLNYCKTIANAFPKAGDDSLKGKNGAIYNQHGGFVIETQQYPDSINQPNFPDDFILRPGQVYDHRVTYKFGIDKK